MKKITVSFLIVLLCMFSFSGCGKTELDKNNPVTLTMWHIYGEQADSPMNKLIDEFNQTVGLEKGIIIDVTGMSGISAISNKLADAASKQAGSPQMPDLFFSQKNGALTVGTDNLVNWSNLFEKNKFDDYIPEFLEDGKVGEDLYVFPVAKSTNLLFICGTQFERFSQATGVSYSNLTDWDSFFDVAAKYYEYSNGKPFCCFDFPLLLTEIAAKSITDETVNNTDGTYNFHNKDFENVFMQFADSLVKGHVAISDLYSNTQLMTGEVMAGIGSSAAILYYNDTVTYPDNTQEPMDLQIFPIPQFKNNKKSLVTQGGAGLCAVKTTSQKTEAAAVFAKWLTEPDRNLEFSVTCGYMPVTQTAFEKVKNYDFPSDDYKKLYTALTEVNDNCSALSEQDNPAYYATLQTFYKYLRENQKTLAKRYADGEDIESLKQEMWQQLKNAK